MSRDIIDITDIAEIREAVVSATLKYIGYSRKQNAATGDPVWQIRRIATQGRETVTQYADQGNFTQIWDNRNDLFPPLVFVNQFSTTFDGISEYLDGGDVLQYDITSPGAFSLWLKPTLDGTPKTILSKRGQTNNWDGYVIRITATGQVEVEFRTDVANNTHTFATVLTSGVWQHIALTYDGNSNMNGLRLFHNGVLDSNLPANVPLLGTMAGTWPFQMGRSYTSDYYSGNFDNMSFWDHSLSGSEVSTLYNGGEPIEPLTVSFNPSLITWFRFGDDDQSPIISDQKDGNDLIMNNMDVNNFVLDVP